MGNWFSRWRRRRPAHLELGRRGEDLACSHLKRLGYKILRRNFRGKRGGEIDIVCRDRSCDTLVFVEVKTRSSEAFGRPSEKVNAKQRRRIITGAMAWLRLLDMPDLNFRFDVVEVVTGPPLEIRVIQNAFNLPEHYIY